MNLETALYRVIRPALHMLGSKYLSPNAQQMMLTIGLQESKFEHRRQINGPARGYWQFEEGGGVFGVMTHQATVDAAKQFCVELDHPFQRRYLYNALEFDAVLAAGFARLLLWSDPLPLPDDQRTGWEYYIRNWRPGRPHPHTWAGHWLSARQTLEVL